MKTIFSWLSAPYYFNPSILFKLKVSFSFGFFVFIFLYIFKPFNLYSIVDFVLEYTILLGIITTSGVFFMLIVPPLLFKNYFDEDKWTVGRNLFVILIGLIIIGSFMWYLGNLYKSTFGIKGLNYITFLTYTFLVGTIPLLFFVFINEKGSRERREKKANEINELKKEKLVEKVLKKEVTICSDNQKEKIVFKVDDLVYISSQGNYASFFIRKNTDLKEKILRVTLTKIDEELQDYSKIIRCHKSYIINVNFITDINGNARGYLLKSDIIPFDIPVSRSFSKQSLKSLLS
ncbi:LytR/AlgR family response regulator transcription factor [Polaribacter uvawellassae]|uniref:LytR/AlgR family response regulator transcription factor n=1 Tax=Polaribacter uvawellassae TaxID=3133495 RepID=UPI00321B4EDC